MYGDLVVVEDVPGEFAERVIEAFHGRPHDAFSFAVSGGDLARRSYERLADDAGSQIDWWKVDVYWGDERCVPLDHGESNYRLVREALLERVGAVNANYPMRCEQGPDPYQLRLGELGRIDLIHLGMGPDGHTASLFPGSPVLKEVFRPVAAVHAAAASIPKRLTFSLPLINAAARVMFLVAGPEKAKVVKAVLTETGSGLPASMVSPTNGRLTWLLDRPAAALLGAAKRR